MKPSLTRQTLDWIDHGSGLGHPHAAASPPAPDQVWAAIADHAAWPKWFDAITRVEPLDPPHRRRRPPPRRTSGPIAVEEEFLAWDARRTIRLLVTHVNAPGIKSMVEDVRLTAAGDGATTVSYTQAIDPIGAKVLRTGPQPGASRKALDKALAGLAQHVGG